MSARLCEVLTYHFKLSRMKARINSQPKRVMVPFTLDEYRMVTLNHYVVAAHRGFGHQICDMFHIFKPLAQECPGWTDHAA